MGRFKLVRISKKKVEVQKIRFKMNFGTVLIAFAFACLVWLYVAGSDTRPEPMDPGAHTTPDTEEGSAVEASLMGPEQASAYSVIFPEGADVPAVMGGNFL